MACGRTIAGDPAFYPQAESGWKRLYFCTEYCLRAFDSDPARFLAAHSRRREASGSRAGEGVCDREFKEVGDARRAGTRRTAGVSQR